MKGSERSELDLLRRRAYGPAADIDDDPDALRRLRELERQTISSSADGVRPEPSDAPRASPSPRGASVTSVVQAEEQGLSGQAPSLGPQSEGSVVPGDATATGIAGFDEGTAGSAASNGAPRHPTRSSPRLRAPSLIWVGWIASLAAVAVVTAVVTYGLVRLAPVESSHGAPQIAALEPESTTTIPTGWFGVGASSAVYEFFGLTLFETTTGFYGTGGDCFTVVLTADLPEDEEAAQNGYSTSGPVYSGCRVGEFPATVSLAVDSASPPELRERFPGAALQFVKVDDQIGVFLGSLPSD
ncbi:hypothetical protein [Microbacterium sp. ABRD28]|uniref:hypothetical protein n=1 Tax=Microbacterium sp. ABRD28 TaxID=2268461 RepID=UPI000F550BA3|nr:hypothetical protein [Microbacterium sp. ABRD28]AZC12816.1 hypothetical protein DT073_02995 [Microbacterium sp. ABRD28]